MTVSFISSGKCFNSVCYSSDGQYIVAGGRSKYVCIYCLENRMLIKKYQLSQNRSLEGILDKLNSKNMTEAGALGLLNISDKYVLVLDLDCVVRMKPRVSFFLAWRRGMLRSELSRMKFVVLASSSVLAASPSAAVPIRVP